MPWASSGGVSQLATPADVFYEKDISIWCAKHTMSIFWVVTLRRTQCRGERGYEKEVNCRTTISRNSQYE